MGKRMSADKPSDEANASASYLLCNFILRKLPVFWKVVLKENDLVISVAESTQLAFFINP